jgi:hypothetical protein
VVPSDLDDSELSSAGSFMKSVASVSVEKGKRATKATATKMKQTKKVPAPRKRQALMCGGIKKWSRSIESSEDRSQPEINVDDEETESENDDEYI